MFKEIETRLAGEAQKFLTDRKYSPYDAEYSMTDRGTIEGLPFTSAYLYTAVYGKMWLAVKNDSAESGNSKSSWSQHLLEAGNSVLVPPNRTATLVYLEPTILSRQPLAHTVFLTASLASWKSRNCTWAEIARVGEGEHALSVRALFFLLCLGRIPTRDLFLLLCPGESENGTCYRYREGRYPRLIACWFHSIYYPAAEKAIAALASLRLQSTSCQLPGFEIPAVLFDHEMQTALRCALREKLSSAY
jgi:hypothetical protein